MNNIDEKTINELTKHLAFIISETNGVSLIDTLELMGYSRYLQSNPVASKLIVEFRRLLSGFQQDEVDIQTLLNHPFSTALFDYFKRLPINFHEEHIHLTGSLSAEFIYPRIKKLLEGPKKKIYEQRIKEVYGEEALPIKSIDDVNRLIRLKDGEQFDTYLRILYLGKLVLNSRKAHEQAAYHMAKELFEKYNVGNLRLKFTLSRATATKSESVPGTENVRPEDVVMGLYEGFVKFQKEVPSFGFVLSPSFRKEATFFDKENFRSKKEHFEYQVKKILELIEKNPVLKKHMTEVDTVGDEKELYRKAHFEEMRSGLRKLQYQGFRIRSHHGETWKILRTGIQSVDNAMNIWHIDTLEHGLSLGINPNYYFHRLYQRIMEQNLMSQKLKKNSLEGREVEDMVWSYPEVKKKLFDGRPLTAEEEKKFIKTKFYTAREIEHYQHDVLNRMIHKNVSLISLPSSNFKLTGRFSDYKDHPFSWWEKKGVQLGVGTDNYITLNTNFIQEMLLLLYSDPNNLKITKLLMIVTKESRRPYISHLLWEMRQMLFGKSA